MTIKILLTKSALSLASFLTVIRGAVLSCAVRFGSAEYCAQIVTENTPSSNKGTTPVKTSSKPFEISREDLGSSYDNPFSRINDILHGRIGVDEVGLDEWIQLVAIAMVEQSQPHLNVDVMYGGGLYSVHHCIQTIRPPAPVAGITETMQ